MTSVLLNPSVQTKTTEGRVVSYALHWKKLGGTWKIDFRASLAEHRNTQDRSRKVEQKNRSRSGGRRDR
jgi:hypothetical protein